MFTVRCLRNSSYFVSRRASFHSSSIPSRNVALMSGESLLTDEQLELKAHADKFAKSVVAPLASSIDRNGKIPKDLWLQLGDQGYLGPTAPTEYGGLGLGFLEHVLIMEQLSRVSGSVGLSYGAHSNLCVNQISRWGTDEQKSKYLPKLISGESIGALAISEPGVGSDAMSIECTAECLESGEFVLNGLKMWITNGPCADVIVIYARVKKEERSSLTAFVIETTDLKGFSVARKLDKIGESVLGNVGGGAAVMMSGLDSERLVLAAGPLGIMQACYDLIVPYVNTRKQFNRLIGDFQLVQLKLSSVYCDLLMHRTLLYSLARGFGTGTGDRKDCAAAIHRGSQMATRAALDAIQLLGGNGYTTEYPAGRLLCDAKLYEIGAGTTEIRQILIGREINEEYRTH